MNEILTKLVEIARDESKTHLQRINGMRELKASVGPTVFRDAIKEDIKLVSSFAHQFGTLMVLESDVQRGEASFQSTLDSAKMKYGNEPDALELIEKATKMGTIK